MRTNADSRRVLAVLVSAILALVGAVGCGGCSDMPSKDRVASEFVKRHPGARIRDMSPGEGDGDAVYWKIRFEGSGSTRLRTEEWQFLRDRDSGWVVRNISRLVADSLLSE